jgi:hypothetical protein
LPALRGRPKTMRFGELGRTSRHVKQLKQM